MHHNTLIVGTNNTINDLADMSLNNSTIEATPSTLQAGIPTICGILCVL